MADWVLDFAVAVVREIFDWVRAAQVLNY